MAERKTTAKERTPSRKRVTFSLYAPEARTVEVVGSFCDWQPKSHILKREANGAWKKTILLLPGSYEYRFLVDGEWRDDPECTERVGNSFGSANCIMRVTNGNAEREAPEAVGAM
jgi:1,4-alpha-glucan branching enzyme